MNAEERNALIKLLLQEETAPVDVDVDVDKVPFAKNSKVIIRCVTHYYVGRVAVVTRDAVLLTEASWVASTGRWHTALATGELDEVEPYPDKVWINRGAMVDWSSWNHELPREAK